MPPSLPTRPRRMALAAGIAACAVIASALPALAGPGSSEPFALSSIGGKGYFWAKSKSRGFELWRTDGTTAGTKIYQEFQPGTAGSDEGSRVWSTGGRLWVFADDGVHGLEPFTINPVTGTRKLLKDIRPGATGSEESAFDNMFVGLNGKVLFPADDGTNGREWWVSDGTRTGTKLLKAVNSDSSWRPQWYAKVGGKMLFSNIETWTTDGTRAGTVEISAVDAGDQAYRPAPVLNGVAIMAGFSDALQTQLYRSNGSALTLIKQINPSGYAGPNGFIKLNGKILFSADDGVHGRELWTTDGTEGGTTRISDINPDGGHSTAAISDTSILPARIGSTVLFVADDGNGYELWKTDGTTVSQVKDINPFGSSGLNSLTASGGKVFFVANDGTNGFELWVSNGTSAGTFMLKNIHPSASGFVDEIVPLKNGKVLFTANDGVNGWEPWVSDGTKAGTRMLKDIR